MSEFLQHFAFANPAWLFLLLALPPLFFLQNRRGSDSGIGFSSLSILSSVGRPPRERPADPRGCGDVLGARETVREDGDSSGFPSRQLEPSGELLSGRASEIEGFGCSCHGIPFVMVEARLIVGVRPRRASLIEC